jgi:hypothetical protein
MGLTISINIMHTLLNVTNFLILAHHSGKIQRIFGSELR